MCKWGVNADPVCDIPVTFRKISQIVRALMVFPLPNAGAPLQRCLPLLLFVLSLLPRFAVARVGSPEEKREADRLFGGSIPVLTLRIKDADMENLRKNPRAYVEADIEEKGAGVHAHAAVKLKGSAGSFQGIDARPGFSVNMEKFKGGKWFHGIPRFQLNNCAQDDTALRELISGEIARKAGVPASRCTHAIVQLNDKFLGLYVLKESFREDFLSTFFKNPEGRLYDGGFCADIRKEMELDRGDGTDSSRLTELVEALKDADAERQLGRVKAVVDVDAYIRYVVLENILCHWDGYSFNRNNYRIYEDPDSRKFHFFLHGMDQTLGDSNWSLLRVPGGGVGTVLWRDAAVKARYAEILKDVYERVLRPAGWAERTEEVGKRVQAALNAVDPKKAEAYAGRVSAAKQQVQARMEACARQLQSTQFLTKLAKGEAASLEGLLWVAQGDNAKSSEIAHDGRKVLLIQATGECKASWRCALQLPAGKYRFEGLIGTRGVVAVETPSGAGAGLRISGGSRLGKNALSENRNWTETRFEFESPGGDQVLVAELCARAGELWIDRKSLSIRKMP